MINIAPTSDKNQDAIGPYRDGKSRLKIVTSKSSDSLSQTQTDGGKAETRKALQPIELVVWHLQ